MRFKAGVKLNTSLIILAAIGLASCSSVPDQPPVVKADKPFDSGGNIDMQLDGGNYVVRAASDQRVRVSFEGNIGNATADLATNGTHATLTIKNTPHSNFRATVELPARADLAVHLAAGNLEMSAITGNKDVDSNAGNVSISTNPNDYSTVNASVKVGNLDAGPFGESGSGLSPQLKWSGPGKYTLRASLTAGNLELKR
jgi:hypothetical protein